MEISATVTKIVKVTETVTITGVTSDEELLKIVKSGEYEPWSFKEKVLEISLSNVSAQEPAPTEENGL